MTNNDRNAKRALDTWSRPLTEKVTKVCYGCKRFQKTAFDNPPPGELPEV